MDCDCSKLFGNPVFGLLFCCLEGQEFKCIPDAKPQGAHALLFVLGYNVHSKKLNLYSSILLL